MGGGDLNSKKSWHPNTMKNQERVWKAEQAAADEKKRISELQRERAEERDRAELNRMAEQAAGSYSDNRLNWMYDKPDKKVQEEDYLLGKSIDQNYGRSDKDDHSTIPAIARHVVGSSMLVGGGDVQVDLARKIREDPLLLVKERERIARAALLNNPLHRRRLADLLRKEQEQRKYKTKKKSKKKSKDLDNLLAAKLNALSGGKGVDIAKLLSSDDSSSDSSVETDKKKKKSKAHKHRKKVKKSKAKKKSHDSIDNTDSSNDDKYKKKLKSRKRPLDKDDSDSKKETRKRKSENDSDDERKSNENRKRTNVERDNYKKSFQYPRDECVEKRSSRDKKRDFAHVNRSDSEKMRNNRDSGPETDRRRNSSPVNSLKSEKRSKDLSEAERAKKIAMMAAAGAEREVQRGRRVAEQRRRDSAADAAHAAPRALRHPRPLPDSLETRIHSNRHYIQRDRQHMNEHFARR